MEFSVIQGDIAAEETDALVNAAGTSLRMGSGVAGSLLRESNGSIESDARTKGPIDLGDAVVSDAYDLDADYVIHAVVVPHGGVRQQATSEVIRRATRNSLSKADELGCRSVVLPALGCGNGGVYIREGGEVICRSITNYDPDSLDTVKIIAYTDHARNAIEDAASAVTT